MRSTFLALFLCAGVAAMCQSGPPAQWSLNHAPSAPRNIFQAPFPSLESPADSKTAGPPPFSNSAAHSYTLFAQNGVPGPFPMPFREGPYAKAEPIPTRWPDAKFEPIPTQWPGLKMLLIASQPGSPQTAQVILRRP
jgi:hypothetical protein